MIFTLHANLGWMKAGLCTWIHPVYWKSLYQTCFTGIAMMPSLCFLSTKWKVQDSFLCLCCSGRQATLQKELLPACTGCHSSLLNRLWTSLLVWLTWPSSILLKLFMFFPLFYMHVDLSLSWKTFYWTGGFWINSRKVSSLVGFMDLGYSYTCCTGIPFSWRTAVVSSSILSQVCYQYDTILHLCI